MFINFARTLFEILVEDEFSYIKQGDNKLIYETEVLSLYKDKGSILYLVLIFNAEKLDNEKYRAYIKHYSELLGDENRAKLILMNVITNNHDNELGYQEDYASDKSCYVFTYNVDLEKNEVYSPEDQPELLGIRIKIEAAVSGRGEEYVNGTHLVSLESELVEKYAITPVGNNIFLTSALIGINVLVWLLMELTGGSKDTWTLVAFGAVSRNLVFNLHDYYRLAAAIFLHIGVLHLANNCLALYIFGGRVEKYFGKLKLIIIYLLSGIVGNAVTIAFLPNLSAGASGAIFGLIGALLSVTYKTGRTVGDLSPYVVLLLSVSSIGMGFVIPGVNNYAHVAGFMTGVITERITHKS